MDEFEFYGFDDLENWELDRVAEDLMLERLEAEAEEDQDDE